MNAEEVADQRRASLAAKIVQDPALQAQFDKAARAVFSRSSSPDVGELASGLLLDMSVIKLRKESESAPLSPGPLRSPS